MILRDGDGCLGGGRGTRIVVGRHSVLRDEEEMKEEKILLLRKGQGQGMIEHG